MASKPDLPGYPSKHRIAPPEPIPPPQKSPPPRPVKLPRHVHPALRPEGEA